jgi:hypothetical protein
MRSRGPKCWRRWLRCLGVCVAGGQDTLELRSLLGKFGLSGPDAIKPMKMLSGGQKSRAGMWLIRMGGVRPWGVWRVGVVDVVVRD